MVSADSDDIATKVCALIAEVLNAPVVKVVPEAVFITDLNADSIDIVELVIAIEKEFALEIPDEDAEQIRTVKDAIAYVTHHLL
ncbi:MAG: acyl carrier protein [Deltaproteobacteria bacterium]|nr:acyl carrier protein [Deltaproteobacteria bacterium]